MSQGVHLLRSRGSLRASLALLVPWVSLASVTEMASRPGWVCTYGAERTVCSGPSVIHGVEAIEAVGACGAEERICSRTWTLEREGDALWDAALAWGGAIEDELGARAWVVTPSVHPDRWVVTLRSRDRRARLEVAPSGLEARIDDREPCPGADAVVAALDPVLSPLVGAALEPRWKSIDEVELNDGINASVIALNRHEVGRTTRPADLAQRVLLSSEALACLRETKRAKDTMDLVRRAFAAWTKAIGPDGIASREAIRAELEAERAPRP